MPVSSDDIAANVGFYEDDVEERQQALHGTYTTRRGTFPTRSAASWGSSSPALQSADDASQDSGQTRTKPLMHLWISAPRPGRPSPGRGRRERPQARRPTPPRRARKRARRRHRRPHPPAAGWHQLTRSGQPGALRLSRGVRPFAALSLPQISLPRRSTRRTNGLDVESPVAERRGGFGTPPVLRERLPGATLSSTASSVAKASKDALPDALVFYGVRERAASEVKNFRNLGPTSMRRRAAHRDRRREPVGQEQPAARDATGSGQHAVADHWSAA